MPADRGDCMETSNRPAPQHVHRLHDLYVEQVEHKKAVLKKRFIILFFRAHRVARPKSRTHRNNERSLKDKRQALEGGVADKGSVFSEIQERAFQRLQEVERTIDESLNLPDGHL